MTAIRMDVETQILNGEGATAAWSPLPTQLRFSIDDPIATVLHLGTPEGDEAIDWIFAFDLIHRVAVGWSKAGVGDVRFDPDELSEDHVLLRLSSPGGQALLRLKTLDVKKYVQAVKSLLDAQPEVDIVAESLDKTISAILEGSS